MKTNKIIGYGLLTVILAIALAFIACDDDPEPEPAHTHQWGGWIVTTAATCMTQGIETRACTVDLSHTETRYVSIDPNAHNWGEWTVILAPTETTNGMETRVCKLASTHIETLTINATGGAGHIHDWGEWIQTTAPTCTEDGIETRTCSLDPSHKETKPGADALGHNWGGWEITTAPTQTASGIETRTCANDSTHKETRVVSATGDSSHTHIWSAWTPVTMPTCTEPGVNKRTCALDSSHIETNPLEPIGHSYGEWIQTTAPTCTTSGVDTRTCSHNAAHKETRTGTAALGHTYGNWTQTTAPTCTTAGVETRTCARDPSHKETRTVAINPNAHDWGNWIQTTAPTCTTAGVETRTCARDPSHKETRAGAAALGHTYGNWTQTTAPTCTTAGVETRTCTRDPSHKETQTVAINPDAHNWGNWTENQPADGIEAIRCIHNSSHIRETRTVMVFVQGGTFQLGKDLGTAATGDVTPVSNVTLTSFYIGKYEVTQAQWLAVMGRTQEQQQALRDITGSTTNYGRGGEYPVYSVNWYEMLVFCNKLSVMEGLTPAYSISNSTNPDDWGTVPDLKIDYMNIFEKSAIWDAVEVVSGSNGYRLPTEAQWEYAAKGGNPTAYGWVGYTYSGSNTVDDVAWYSGNNGSEGTSTYGTKAVGTKAANRLGLYDMSGNVYEWCWDWYGDYSSGTKTNPTGASSGSNRVVRNVCWALEAERGRSVFRYSNSAWGATCYFGFRLVRPAQ